MALLAGCLLAVCTVIILNLDMRTFPNIAGEAFKYGYSNSVMNKLWVRATIVSYSRMDESQRYKMRNNVQQISIC